MTAPHYASDDPTFADQIEAITAFVALGGAPEMTEAWRCTERVDVRMRVSRSDRYVIVRAWCDGDHNGQVILYLPDSDPVWRWGLLTWEPADTRIMFTSAVMSSEHAAVDCLPNLWRERLGYPTTGD